jgi:hypothetical protein
MVTAQEPAIVYLTWKDPSKMTRVVMWSHHTRHMEAQKDEFDKLPILNYYKKRFEPYDYLAIELIVDSSDGIDYTDSYIEVPVTFRNKRTGQVFEDTLTVAGDRKFTMLADATAFVAGQLKEWGYFQIPDGLELKLGHKEKFNSRVLIVPYDDTA